MKLTDHPSFRSADATAKAIPLVLTKEQKRRMAKKVLAYLAQALRECRG